MYLLKRGSRPVQERKKRRKIDVFQLPDGSMPVQSQQQKPANVLMEDKESKKAEPLSKMTSRKDYQAASKQLQ